MRASRPMVQHGLTALIALGIALMGVPLRAGAQVSISSAANQLFHVNDASTTISPITVTDITGGNIKFNRDIRITIPTGFNMTWDATVTTATLTGSAASKCATTVAYSNGNLTVTVNVTGTFAAGDVVVIAGLKFTNFTATSAGNNLQLDLKNNPGFNASDTKTITIGPYYNIFVSPVTTNISALPTNGASLTQNFTLTDSGAVSDSYDLFTSKNPGTAFTVVSIGGIGVSQGALPDSARRAAITSGSNVTVTVTYRIGNAAGGTIDTLKLMARSVGNPAKTSTGVLALTVIRPALAIGKAVSPTGAQPPGTDLTYTSTLTNTGSASASGVSVVDSIPTLLQFKVSSTSTTLPAGATVVTSYSNDGGLTWTYTPVSGACSATPGFDRCVNRIRWALQSALSSVAPNNQATLRFVARIR